MINTSDAGNIIPFTAKREAEKEGTIVITHGMHTLEATKAVSDYIKDLLLESKQSDTLINLLKEQLLIAEREAFVQGFTACMDEIQGCGLNAAMDKGVMAAEIRL